MCLGITTVSAQVAHVLTPGAPGGTEVTYLVSPAYPVGLNAGSDPLPFFWGSSPLVSFYGGGVAIDQGRRRVYASDGNFITQESMLRFPPMSAPVPPVAVPIITPGTSGFLTGMSADPENNRLIICDPLSFRFLNPFPPYTPMGPAITPPTGHSPFTGVAHDPSDNTLWFCSIQGGVYHTTIAGAPIFGEYPISTLPTPLKGICVDRSEGVGTFGTIFPTAGTYPFGRPRIWVTDGSMVIDAITFLTIPVGTSMDAYGMAFSADGQFSPGGSVAASTGLEPVIRQHRPSANGFFLGCDLLLEDAPVTALHYLFYNWYPQPGIPVGTGMLCVYPANIPMGFTSPSGTSSFTIPDILAGISLSFQYLVQDPGTTTPWVLTDCLTFMSSRL